MKSLAVPSPVFPVAGSCSTFVVRERPLFSDPADACARVLVAGLFVLLAWSIGRDFLQTGRPTGLLLVVSESLVVVLMVLRRQAKRMDGRLAVRVMTGVSLAVPLLMRPALRGGLFEEAVTAVVGAAGLCIVIGGKMSLGRSFGLLPADRGIVIAGMYRLVRHPIYLGYFFTHIAFLLAHPTGWNLTAALAADATLIIRAHLEERTLAQDAQYVRYCGMVRWRLIPGLY